LHMLMACVTCSARFRLAPDISSSATDIVAQTLQALFDAL
jgi:hypothetical protein